MFPRQDQVCVRFYYIFPGTLGKCSKNDALRPVPAERVFGDFFMSKRNSLLLWLLSLSLSSLWTTPDPPTPSQTVHTIAAHTSCKDKWHSCINYVMGRGLDAGTAP